MPSTETTLRANYPHLIPLKGDEGSEGSFYAEKEPSNSRHEGNEGGSSPGSGDVNSVVKDDPYTAKSLLDHLSLFSAYWLTCSPSELKQWRSWLSIRMTWVPSG